MLTNASHDLANDLMAIWAHLQTQLSHIPGNLIAAMSWHAIGELYHVSQLGSHPLSPVLIPVT